ncbi:13606_t:CDS:2 [Funneliformis mosseae]|uniref:13606_t:CDS:1 n=1 Tax=Funneliformis mosseae TaxID=27381 RepID=A0A9N9EZY0_FUNMO|nr:13606_t:CDS:2 [Funneliformis mosseae]
MFNSDKAMFHIGLIPDRWYNEKFSDFQEEPAITIFSEKNTVKPMYKHQVRPDFSLLHEIHHTQAFLETIKQNLSHQAKYNQGFGYTKKAIRLALEIGCEDKLNNMLQRWIKEKENETNFRQLEINKENLPNISDPYQTRTKGALKKRIKRALKGNQKQKSSGIASTHRSHGTSGTIGTGVTTMAESSSCGWRKTRDGSDSIA